MNEPIRSLQLADQAYEEYTTDTTKYEVNIPDEFCKKYAELIVQECCEVAHCHAHVDGLTLGGISK